MEVVRRKESSILRLKTEGDSAVLTYNGVLVVALSTRRLEPLELIRDSLMKLVGQRTGLKNTDIMAIVLTALSEMGETGYIRCLPDMEYINGEVFVKVQNESQTKSTCYNFGKDFDRALSYTAPAIKTDAASRLLVTLLKRMHANAQITRAVRIGSELGQELHSAKTESCETLVIKRHWVEEQQQTREKFKGDSRAGTNNTEAPEESKDSKEQSVWSRCDTCQIERKVHCRLFSIKNETKDASPTKEVYKRTGLDPQMDTGRIIIARLFGT